jgi:tripartite-type tricarboxylate transporter receptor subunit TctC
MRLHRREFVRLVTALGLPMAAAGGARAQAGASLRLLVGFVPGGTVDVIARALAEGLRASGVNCVVDNRPGASGRLATEALLAAPADGGTLMLTPSTNLTLFPHAHAGLRYSLADFAFVGIAADVQFGLAVHHETGPRTLEEFLERARKDPKAGFFGTPGAGSVMQLLGDVLARRAKVPLTSVPYKGGAAAVNDVVGGTLPAVIGALPALMPMHRARRLRILAVTAEKPLASVPEATTFEAAGFPDLTASEYMCLVSRKGVAPATVDRWNGLLAAAVKAPPVAAAMDRLGFQPSGPVSPDAMARKVAADSARWEVAVRETGFKPAE